MLKQGYIKLFRKIVNWEWYTDVNTCHLFMHMLIMANHDTQKWRGEVIERGTFVTSYGSLSSETGLTVREVRTALKHLISTGDIEVKATKQNTRIYIVKYDFYQKSDKQNDKVEAKEISDDIGDIEHSENLDVIESDNQATNLRQTSDTQSDKQTTTNKNVKKLKNKKNVKNEEENISTFAQSDSQNLSMQFEEIHSEPVITFILNDGTEHPIYEHEIKQWQEIYPAVDVMNELRKMKGWCLGNPKKRKTKKGVGRFVNNWLSDKQDNLKPKTSAKKSEKEELPF